MATADISTRGRRKTMLIYRADTGLALRQVDTRAKGQREIPLTAEDIDEIVRRWPEFRLDLLNAGAPIAAPVTPSPSDSRASQGRGNSPSSPEPGRLL